MNSVPYLKWDRKNAEKCKRHRERQKIKVGEEQFKCNEAERKRIRRRLMKNILDAKGDGSVIKSALRKHMVFKHPFTMLISGPSGCGKTELVKLLLYNKHIMFDVEFNEIIWHYAVWQPSYEVIKKVAPKIRFVRGIPSEEEYSKNKVPKLLILDDLMKETKGDVVGTLFTRGSHHNNLSVIYIVQNLFPNQGKGKGEQRDISLNTKYMLLFKNPRDGQQPLILGVQMGMSKFISEAYRIATKRPHGYLMVDFTQNADEDMRYRTLISPQDSMNVVFTQR